jgi:hypothetical protein
MHCIFLLVGIIFGNAVIEEDRIIINDEATASTGDPAYEVQIFLYTVFYQAANVVYVTSK